MRHRKNMTGYQANDVSLSRLATFLFHTMKRRNLIVGASAAVVGTAGVGAFGFRQMGSMADYETSVRDLRTALPVNPEIRDLVRYATLAANSHNSQPWRFQQGGNGIDILPDLSRRLSAVDPDNHHLFVSLGCASENLSIAAAMSGKSGAQSFDAANGGSIKFQFGDGPLPEAALFDAISKRQSTRGTFDGKSPSASDLSTLAKSASIEGVDVVFITDRLLINKVRDLVLAGNATQMADAAFVRELKQWLRFNPHQATTSGDGLFSATSANPVLPTWLGPSLFDLAFTPKAENDKYARQLASSAGIVVFVAHKDDPQHWVRVGQACQRFALQATALGLKHAYINQPVEIASLRPELAALVGLSGRRPDIVMRFGYGPTLPFSVRRPVSEVLI